MSRRSQRLKERTTDASVSRSVTKRPARRNTVTTGKGRSSQAATGEALSIEQTTSTATHAGIIRNKENSTHRRRGKLHQILDMPLDIIVEICLCLDTKDMLNLSRLSKAFRAMFTSRSMRFIWTAASLNVVDLPPYPPDLTELAYANLLFDPHCHNCMSKNCHNVYWGCRVRLCKSCHDELAVTPTVYYSGRHHPHNDVTAEILHKPDRVNALLPSLGQLPNGMYTQYKPALDKLMTAWEEVFAVESKEKHWEFFAEHQRTTAIIAETVPALMTWYNNYRSSRANELLDIRNSRRDAIVEKLKEDGWGTELTYLAETSPDDNKRFGNLPEVRKTQALTPRIWNSIRDRITEFMQEIRDKRLWGIYMNTLISRLYAVDDIVRSIVSTVPHCNLTPRELVFRSLPLRDVIDPANTAFKAEDSTSMLRTLILEYLEEREREGKQALAAMIREETGLKETVDPFSLAIGSLFTCSFCYSVFKYREAVHHVCIYGPKKLPPKPEWMTIDYFNAAARHNWDRGSYGRQQPVWSIEVYRSQFKNVAAVIKACGFEINDTTAKLDEDKDLRLICTNHLQKQKYIPIMSWRTAAHGLSCCRFQEFDPVYEIASDEHKTAVKASEKKQVAQIAQIRAKREKAPSYRCAHCTELSEAKPKALVAAHLAVRHSIAEPTSKDIRFLGRRAEETIVDPVYLVSHKCEGRNHALHYVEKEKGYLITYWKIK